MKHLLLGDSRNQEQDSERVKIRTILKHCEQLLLKYPHDINDGDLDEIKKLLSESFHFVNKIYDREIQKLHNYMREHDISDRDDIDYGDIDINIFDIDEIGLLGDYLDNYRELQDKYGLQ